MMKRKYDTRNKRSFIFIAILMVAIIGIFSLFIYKYLTYSGIQYSIPAGSVIQDVLKNYIVVDDDAVLKIRWNERYYLEYQGEKINLGKKVIVYNSITGGLNLYGTFYEINSEGKVIENTEETILENTSDCKFYKLDDREYLLVGTKISSGDKKIETGNYLLVELDKLGNAKLSNDELNLKTITPTTLLTTLYSFDINNEILSFEKYNINLKKIIGSTNEYTEKEEEDNKGGGGATGNGQVVGGNGQGGNGGNGTGTGIGNGIGNGTGVGDVINNNDTGNVVDKEEVMDKLKTTSIVRIVEGLNQIDIDYVVYDPYNEYASVYVEVKEPSKTNVIYLNKNDTHLTLYDLKPNTEYRLNFIYTVGNEETGALIPNTFVSYDVRTLLPEYDITVNKISTIDKKVYYKVTLQDGFDISDVKVNLKFKYDEEFTEIIIDEEGKEVEEKKKKTIVFNENSTAEVSKGDKYVFGYFDIKDYSPKTDTLFTFKITGITDSSGNEIKVEDSYSFRYGR